MVGRWSRKKEWSTSCRSVSRQRASTFAPLVELLIPPPVPVNDNLRQLLRTRTMDLVVDLTGDLESDDDEQAIETIQIEDSPQAGSSDQSGSDSSDDDADDDDDDDRSRRPRNGASGEIGRAHV